jgi:hypothetical protein
VAAIKKLQIKYHLPITGVVDAATQVRLDDEAKKEANAKGVKLLNLATPDTAISLLGTGFTPTGNNISVKDRIVATDIASADGFNMIFPLPTFLPCSLGEVCPLKVINDNGISNALPFKLIPPAQPTPTPPPAPTLTLPIPTPTPATLPFKIISPNGGENWAYGSAQTIKWQDADKSWAIYLTIIDSSGKQVLRSLANNLANTGSANWVVDLPPGQYIMYAEACAGCSNMVWDYSDAPFTVTAPVTPTKYGKVASSLPTNQSLVMLTPDIAGQSWAIGSKHDLLWSGGQANWLINLSLIDQTTYKTYGAIFGNLANTGSVSWTVPSDLPSGIYSVYANCANCALDTFGLYSYSLYNFTVPTP